MQVIPFYTTTTDFYSPFEHAFLPSAPMNEGCLLFDYTARALSSTESIIIPLSKVWEMNQQISYQTWKSLLEVIVEKGTLSPGSSHSHSPTQNSSGVITIVYFPMHAPHSKHRAYHNEMYIYTKKYH